MLQRRMHTTEKAAAQLERNAFEECRNSTMAKQDLRQWRKNGGSYETGMGLSAHRAETAAQTAPPAWTIAAARRREEGEAKQFQ